MLPRNTTHDWSASVDREHLAAIRRDPARFAPGGPVHLLLEVLAYPADEAAVLGGGRCLVTILPDGFRVADEGRGTATVRDEAGRAVRKPVMATADLRFFATTDPPLLPDGHPRRGMSVVAALSERLEHTNERAEGAWTQRYRHGEPDDDLQELAPTGRTGTTITAIGPVLPRQETWRQLVTAWPQLTVSIRG